MSKIDIAASQLCKMSVPDLVMKKICWLWLKRNANKPKLHCHLNNLLSTELHQLIARNLAHVIVQDACSRHAGVSFSLLPLKSTSKMHPPLWKFIPYSTDYRENVVP